MKLNNREPIEKKDMPTAFPIYEYSDSEVSIYDVYKSPNEIQEN